MVYSVIGGYYFEKSEDFKSMMIFKDELSAIEYAKYLENELKRPGLYKSIIKDMANYSYPLLSVQSRKSFLLFFKYYISLSKKGFWNKRYGRFHTRSRRILRQNR